MILIFFIVIVLDGKLRLLFLSDNNNINIFQLTMCCTSRPAVQLPFMVDRLEPKQHKPTANQTLIQVPCMTIAGGNYDKAEPRFRTKKLRIKN